MSKRSYFGRHFGTFMLCALGIVFASGLFQIFRIRLVAGDLYPEWSSLRSDPDGTRVLFDSLAATGRVVTARKYKPLAQSPERGATILFLGYSPNSLVNASNSDLDGFEQSAHSGNRLVFAMNPGQWSGPPKQEVDGPLAKKWSLAVDRVPGSDDDIELYFAKAANWRPEVIDKGRATVIERAFGSGSIVLSASSEIFANQNLAADRNSELLVQLIGGNAKVIFDESHLGVQDTGSVLGLVHKYRLDGALWGLLALAIAFVWSNAAGFPPPAEPRLATATAGHDSRAGLAQLLRRQIPAARIIDVCLSEWGRANARVKLRKPENGADPIETYRRLQHELTSK